MNLEPYVQLEKKFGEWIGNPYTVACSSGTAALHLALESLELPQGSVVLVPDYTMVACARAVVLAGHYPWFLDCKPDLTVDPAEIERKSIPDPTRLNLKVRAVLAVHTYGRRCDMNRIHEIALARNLHVVEDMAEIHGILPHPQSDAACWSFYKNKIVHGEEGGMVAFQGNAAEHYRKVARSLRCIGMEWKHDFFHRARGHNYRLANLLAEPILHSLEQVEMNLERRRQVEDWYNHHCPPAWRQPFRHTPWVYDIRIRGMNPPQQFTLIDRLNEQGIKARHGFKPMSWQAEFLNPSIPKQESHRAAFEVIYLPIEPTMTEENVIHNLLCTRALAPSSS